MNRNESNIIKIDQNKKNESTANYNESKWIKNINESK